MRRDPWAAVAAAAAGAGGGNNAHPYAIGW